MAKKFYINGSGKGKTVAVVAAAVATAALASYGAVAVKRKYDMKKANKVAEEPDTCECEECAGECNGDCDACGSAKSCCGHIKTV